MYVLIRWVKENNGSVGIDTFVKDNKMLGWEEHHGVIGEKPPKDGWRAFPAQILKVNDSLQNIREAEQRWIDAQKWHQLKSKNITSLSHVAADALGVVDTSYLLNHSTAGVILFGDRAELPPHRLLKAAC
ncbi:hypothetical protein ATANTOWER_014450 [Ataeniobius toweri]|uniref:Uncharacterized protein n=1 Tax=Ataeniobius toweri TaxID=208326 RepID=A0ABU7C7K2_9TELE|nr:hypothetical protein [Ataeniobius toweri]